MLGTTRINKGIGAKRRCVERKETMVYVPILKTLDVILQNETILAEARDINLLIALSTFIHVYIYVDTQWSQ